MNKTNINANSSYKIKLKINNLTSEHINGNNELINNDLVNNNSENQNENGSNNQPSKICMKDLNKEERLRLVREKREQELEKRKREIEENLKRKQELRDKQLKERQKRIDELKQKENEKRAAVEERRKQREELARMRLNELVKQEQEKEYQRLQKIKQLANKLTSSKGSEWHVNHNGHGNNDDYGAFNKSHSAYNLNSNLLSSKRYVDHTRTFKSFTFI